MTRYEQGFMSKCAEYGLGVGESIGLMKTAAIKRLSYDQLVDIFNNGKKLGRIIGKRTWKGVKPGQVSIKPIEDALEKAIKNRDRIVAQKPGVLSFRTKRWEAARDAAQKRVSELDRAISRAMKHPKVISQQDADAIYTNLRNLRDLADYRDWFAAGNIPTTITSHNIGVAHNGNLQLALAKARPDLFQLG